MENILETKNYDQFKFGIWNRNINQRNIQKLDKEVSKNGWKKHPIIVNDKMEVIDGQHRLVYARAHDLPVYYIVVDGLTVDDCVAMNNSRMAWSPLDFIKLYASQGNENYIRLKELVDEYTFAPVSQIVAIVKNQCGNGTLSSSLRKGEYTLTENEAIEIKGKLDYLEAVTPYLKKSRGRLSSLLKIVSFCYDNEKVDNEKLKNQIENRIATITPPANNDMALVEIERIYNYKIARENYVDITAEYKKYVREQELKSTMRLVKINAQRREQKRNGE